MHKEYIVIISEGARTEKQIIGNIQANFFPLAGHSKEIVFLPFRTDIYALWKVMKEDDFETNIIDVLIERDDEIARLLEGIDKRSISEVYLFFDYDGSSYKRAMVDGIIEEMIVTFDNETGNGKLYISYPMVEALKDLKKDDSCYRRCSVLAKENIGYKSLVGESTDFQHLKHLNSSDWNKIIIHNIKKGNCIVRSKYEMPNYSEYQRSINQFALFRGQLENFIGVNEKIAVLSGFPFFIIDYFGNNIYELLYSDSIAASPF